MTSDRKPTADDVAAAVTAAEKTLADLSTLADAAGVDFSFEMPDGSTARYAHNDGIRPDIEQYWDGVDEDEMSEDWDGEYTGWSNSSTFC